MLHNFFVPNPPKPKQWVVTLTTIPERRHSTLPDTLISLYNSGFDDVHIYVDGDRGPWYELEINYDITYRPKRIRTFGNWLLSLMESYIRQPNADLYMVVQDDVVFCKNLREYLEKYVYIDGSYWNLYTSSLSQKHLPENPAKGWHISKQLGQGALALVFDNKTICDLLSARSMIEKPKHPTRGWCNVDGAVLTGLASHGVKEYIHYPSLVQHSGLDSSMGNKTEARSDCFVGEGFNALELLFQPSGKE